MKKTICILTSTRAEYGLLKSIISKLNVIEVFDVKVVVTGMHLSPEFGLTYQEIENDGISIDKKIEIQMSSDSPVAISKTMGLAMISFSEYFDTIKPDLLVVLGDRYETLAVAITAVNQRIPIAHLYGGETTEGAVDECFRHALSKMSFLHFTSTEGHRKRVIQLGEDPGRVYSVGAIGIENIMNTKLLTKDELEESLHFALDKPYVVITFHPVTLENLTAEDQIKQLLLSCDKLNNMKIIFTKANSDADGRIINYLIDEFVSSHENAIAFTSLGNKRYLSSLKYSSFVMGNSSSGLVEAPTFGTPTINIGDRQKGRLQAESIINCNPIAQEIEGAIDKALSDDFVKVAKNSKNPYGDGNTSDTIIDVIKDYLLNNKMDLKKKFYDIDFDIN